ncbi:unnamed protein product [Nyctereutes procyonoides]|uniref:(raccoon dog) hypothetical protein n=1 Tax=Nyctereutes procyonoides TaxID=34880 RepID=A0A811YX31_NYCPR|nr:unnamed protein product [Nyctereutes procyonoides]
MRRLYQVEDAMEAIGNAGTCLRILANDGVLLAAERCNIHKLLEEAFFSEKIYKLNEDMACSMADITSDVNLLTNELRLIAQRYFLQYQEPIPCEQLVTALCDIKQAYTQFGGKCPFVVSLLYIDWDKHYDFQPCQSICSIRVLRRMELCPMLKEDYKGEMTLKSALALAIKILNKTMDMSELSDEKMVIRILKQKEVEQLIKNHEEEEVKRSGTRNKKIRKRRNRRGTVGLAAPGPCACAQLPSSGRQTRAGTSLGPCHLCPVESCNENQSSWTCMPLSVLVIKLGKKKKREWMFGCQGGNCEQVCQSV